MAPLPPQSTARVWFDYFTGGNTGVEHTVQFRYLGNDRTAQSAQERFAAFLTALQPGTMPAGWRVIRVRTALAGETFSVAQAAIASVNSFVGTNAAALTRAQQANELTWQARGLNSPRRCDISIFGFQEGNLSGVGRFNATPSGTDLASRTWAALVASSAVFVAIDGTPLVWYPYVNTGRNSYWKRRTRIS